MRSFILAGLALLGMASAIPMDVESRSTQPLCLSPREARRVAQNFRALIHEPFNKTLAVSAMVPGFTDYSDSVIELINSGCSTPLALGSATFTSRGAFIKGQSSQAPIPFQILNLWNNCDTVVIRWRASAPGIITTPQEPVTGIIVIETRQNKKTGAAQPFLIETVYSEFNSGAWLYDLGVFVPNCTTASKRSLGTTPFIGML